jgi:hypothetical protein
MKKILLLLLLSGLAAGLSSHVIADNSLSTAFARQTPIFVPPVLYGADLHPAPILLLPFSVTAPLTWRRRNEWEKRRTDQWSEIEWQRQQWRRETGGEAAENATTRAPAPTVSY